MSGFINADVIINKSPRWQKELHELRRIVLECGLTEEIKWGKPCYTYKGKNIVILNNFKDNCGLGFFKGSLMKDPSNILQKPGENSNEGRVIRFTSIEDIIKLEADLKLSVYEAIEVEKSGLKFEQVSCIDERDIPDELQAMFDEMPDFKAAFEALTPGRRRGYVFFFSQAKQSRTRRARIEKYVDRIFDGKGMNDH